ncbi:vesicular inhibitory amino acid transporter-like [Rhopilema esculentum]|uniref:vesicular inhibitory amino acid transporter-like n=1 Tax=Rhopilema esculentum TaxID=499914 RepID=UPI0031D031A3|eukprot:gene1871-16370_t
MWYSATVFENFRNGFTDMVNVLRDKGDSTDEEETLFKKEDLEEMPETAKVSNLQTFWNIFNANQGVVILTMPFVVLCGGYLSLIATATVAATSNYTSKKLIKCLYEKDPETGLLVRMREGYEEIGEAFAGAFGRWMVYVAMIVEQLSYCTLLLILCGSILHNSFPDSGFNKMHWSMLAFVLVIPNAFMVNLGQVAWVSLVTVLVGQLVYIVVAAYSFYHASRWSVHETPPFEMGKFFIGMGIVVVSYSSQPYMPAIHGSMRHPRKYSTVMNITYFAITMVKIVFGIIGYLTFKGETQQVITNNLPHGLFKTTVNMGVLVLALASFTFPAYTVFVIIDKITLKRSRDWLIRKIKRLKEKGTWDETGIEDDDEDFDDEEEMTDKKSLIKEKRIDEEKPSRWKRALVRLSLITVALAVAIAIPHFGLYMALVGSFTGMCLSFIFPCLFHMKLQQNEMKKYEFFLDTAIIAFGSVSAGVGMYYSSLALVDAYSGVH